jgi:hypothetical protein
LIIFAQVDEMFDVRLLALALADAVENLQHPLRADAAGDALAARFLLDKFQEEPRHVDHAAILVHHDQAAGAHDRAEFGERFIVQGDVQMLLGDAAAGGAADLRCLELLGRRGPAADIVDQIAQGHSNRHFDQPGVLDRAGQREDLGPLALAGAVGGVPLAAAEQDRRHVGVRLHVVQQGRLSPKTRQRGEGRPRAGFPPVAFDRGQQGGFLAADEGSGAHADLQLEIEAGAENVFAQQPALARLGKGDLEPLDGQRILGADVDISLRRADRERGNRHAFDHRVGVAFDDAAVHEGAGIALVGVADDEFLTPRSVSGERPFPPRGKPGPSAAAKPGNLHLPEHCFRVVRP